MISPSKRRGKAGFTLIEMLVVLVILGLALGIVLLRGPLRSATLDVRTAAAQVAQGMRLARARAIQTDRLVAVAVDANTHLFQVGGSPPQALPNTVAITVDGGAGETERIVFEPDGSASGGRVDLASGGGRMRVAVDWLTGRVSVADAP